MAMIATADSLGESEVKSLLEENLTEEENALKNAQKVSERMTKETAQV